MEAWFREYYEDAANPTPRSDSELLYLPRGPYIASEELGHEFGHLVPEDRIQVLVKKLEKEARIWTPTPQNDHEFEMAETAAAIKEAEEFADELEDAVASPVIDATAGQTHEVSASYGFVDDHSGSVASPSVGTRVARRARALEQNQSTIWPGEKHTPTATDGESPPIVPTGGGDTAGASPPDPSATFAGGGAFHADATVVPPEPPNAGPVTQRAPSRIEADYINLLCLAISLERMARDEIGRLSGERPNDPHTIENNKKQCDLLSILADGFSRLAAALMEYSEGPQPLLAGKAKKIADDLSAQFEVWWKNNAGEAIDWAVRIPILTASIAALGWTGANMTFATAAVSGLIGGPNAIAAIKAAWKRKKRR